MNEHLALVIPVYNEAKTLEKNMDELVSILHSEKIIFSMTLVDDGSKDSSWQIIKSLSDKYDFVEGVRLSRNFGKENAIFAGIELTEADLYLITDSDLQFPPRYIPQMLSVMNETGCDIVEGIKEDRGKESLIYKAFAKTYYKFLKILSGLEFGNSSDFKLLNRNVVDALRSFGESNVFFRGLVDFTGFHREQIFITIDERVGDTSKFSTRKLIVFGLRAILAYSSAPLYLTIFLGTLFLVLALVLGIQTFYMYLSHNAASGFSTVILLILLTGSIVMFCLGIIGAYISRIFDEVKRRPRYIVSKKIKKQ